MSGSPPPPPPDVPFEASSPPLSWREQRALQEALDSAKTIYRDDIVNFPLSAWNQTLHVSRLESSDGTTASAVRVTIPSVKATVVLKGSSSVAQDWLGQVIVRRVLGPGSVPAARLLEYAGTEWGIAKQGVLKAFPRASGLDRPVLTLMAFVDGVSLDSLAGGVYAPCLLRQLGALCAVDGCIGNFDRMPVGDVFDNDGNCSNALVNHKGQLVAIDTAVGLPVNPAAYVERLRAWLRLPDSQRWPRTIRALETSNVMGGQRGSKHSSFGCFQISLFLYQILSVHVCLRVRTCACMCSFGVKGLLLCGWRNFWKKAVFWRCGDSVRCCSEKMWSACLRI